MHYPLTTCMSNYLQIKQIKPKIEIQIHSFDNCYITWKLNNIMNRDNYAHRFDRHNYQIRKIQLGVAKDEILFEVQ